MPELALVGAACLADGHPTECTEPAPGSIQGSTPVTIDGTSIADQGADRMHYDPHAHDYAPEPGCHDVFGHDLTPDQSPPITVDGQPVMRETDDTTDPGSGGRAWIDDSGGNTAVTHTP